MAINFPSGHQAKYQHFVRFNTGSFGVSSSIGDRLMNDCIAQNTEFCFAASSQVRVTTMRFRNPIYKQLSGSSIGDKTLLHTEGPFPVSLLPDGTPAPLYVNAEVQILNAGFAQSDGLFTFHYRMNNDQNIVWDGSEQGTVEVLKGDSAWRNVELSTPSSSISVSSSILEIKAQQVPALQIVESGHAFQTASYETDTAGSGGIINSYGNGLYALTSSNAGSTGTIWLRAQMPDSGKANLPWFVRTDDAASMAWDWPFTFVSDDPKPPVPDLVGTAPGNIVAGSTPVPASGVKSIAWNKDQYVFIGMYSVDGTAGSAFMDIDLTEIRTLIRTSHPQLFGWLDVYGQAINESDASIAGIRRIYAQEFIPKQREVEDEAAWTPSNLGSLAGWWKATNAEINDDGVFTTVYDQSGFERHMSQSSNLGPTVSVWTGSTGIGTQTMMRFNGSTQYLSSVRLTTPGNAQAMWYVGTLERSIAAADSFAMSWSDGATRRGIVFPAFVADNVNARLTGVDVAGPAVFTQPVLIVVNNDGTTTSIWKNGTIINIATQGEARDGILGLGAADGATRFYQGTIAEAGVLTGSMSTEDIGSLWSYVQTKYQLT